MIAKEVWHDGMNSSLQIDQKRRPAVGLIGPPELEKQTSDSEFRDESGFTQ